jgi:hypothetical protein
VTPLRRELDTAVRQFGCFPFPEFLRSFFAFFSLSFRNHGVCDLALSRSLNALDEQSNAINHLHAFIGVVVHVLKNMHQNFYKLMNQFSSPSRVASTLDRKRFSGSTLLSLNIHRNRIGIAVASHPSLGETCHELEPLRFADDHITIDKKCLERFQKIIRDYKVCGIVVSWPLQHETGRMGAACGRVLYALEEILDKSGEVDDNILTSGRPLCLWDSGHIIPKQKANPRLSVDSFGRCAQYGNTTTKQEYRASQEQYYEDELTVVQQVWGDFCKVHWPELYSKAAVDQKNEQNGMSHVDKSIVEGRIDQGDEEDDHEDSHARPNSRSGRRNKSPNANPSLVQMAR